MFFGYILDVSEIHVVSVDKIGIRLGKIRFLILVVKIAPAKKKQAIHKKVKLVQPINVPINVAHQQVPPQPMQHIVNIINVEAPQLGLQNAPANRWQTIAAILGPVSIIIPALITFIIWVVNTAKGNTSSSSTFPISSTWPYNR